MIWYTLKGNATVKHVLTDGVKEHILPLWPQMIFDPMIITWGLLGLIGDYCGKIQ